MAMLKPLPAGKYLARCKEDSRLKAVANGHSTVWPESIAISDGNWVRFFQGSRQVFDCNASYANAHFLFRPAQRRP
jgi:hypothetical protein